MVWITRDRLTILAVVAHTLPRMHWKTVGWLDMPSHDQRCWNGEFLLIAVHIMRQWPKRKLQANRGKVSNISCIPWQHIDKVSEIIKFCVACWQAPDGIGNCSAHKNYLQKGNNIEALAALDQDVGNLWNFDIQDLLQVVSSTEADLKASMPAPE